MPRQPRRQRLNGWWVLLLLACLSSHVLKYMVGDGSLASLANQPALCPGPCHSMAT